MMTNSKYKQSGFRRNLILVLFFIAGTLGLTGAANALDPIYTGWLSDDAVGGYDPVAYFTEGKPVKGEKAHSLKYKGATWKFSSQENLELFKASPDKYAPQYGGYCAWAIAAKNEGYEGNPKHWNIVDGKLYLNYDQDIKTKWEKDIPGFIKTANENWPKLVDDE